MAEPKTRRNDADVNAFLDAVEDKQKLDDSLELVKLMSAATGSKARMWGSSIVGFGTYHYKYASGREGDWPITGFSPRKQNLSIYIMPGFSRYETLMARLGKHKIGKSCLYVKKLDDIDLDVLKKLVGNSVADMRKMYECS